jgi:hypothetical protein
MPYFHADLVGIGVDGDAAVLPACGRPTWIRCPPIMIARRTDTRRFTISGSGRRGGWAVPPRAPRSWARVSRSIQATKATLAKQQVAPARPNTLLGRIEAERALQPDEIVGIA